MGNFYRNWIEASVNLQCLEEFYIKIRNFKLESCTDFLQYGVLDQCPKLKILKIRRRGRRADYLKDAVINFDVLNTIASFNSKSLQKLHLYLANIHPIQKLIPDDSQTMKKFLEKITENMPQIQHFLMYPCGQYYDIWDNTDLKNICQQIEAEKKIKIKIWNECHPAYRTNFVFSRI